MDALRVTEIENERQKELLWKKDVAIMKLKERIKLLEAKQPQKQRDCPKHRRKNRFHPNRGI